MYESVIRGLGDWQSMTDDQIVAAVTAIDQPFAEPEKWMTLGIAAIIGEQNMPALLSWMETAKIDWIRQDMAFPGLPIGDPVFNAKLVATGNVFCQAIAAHGRRLVSRCYLAGLADDASAIKETIKAMRLELRKRAWRTSFATRYNAAMIAVDNYNGVGPEPTL